VLAAWDKEGNKEGKKKSYLEQAAEAVKKMQDGALNVASRIFHGLGGRVG